jgi:HK97 family phage major capsid protein
MKLTEEQKAKREAARRAREEREQKMLKKLAELEESNSTMAEQLRDAQERLALFEGLDPKAILSSIEELKAANETVRDKIRRDKGGFYVPGIEDEAKDFNLCRAVAGAASGWTLHKDTKEYEICRQATEVARNSAGIDSDGGYFIPDQVIADVIGPLYQDSVMIALDGDTGRTRVSVITGLDSPKVRIPKFNSGMIAYWIGEKSRYTTSKPDVGVVTMDAKKLGLATTITEEMATRANYGFDNLLRNDMRRVAAEEIDRVVLYGSGNEFQPRGVINHPSIRQFYQETNSVTAPTGTPVGGRTDWAALNLMQLVLEESRVRANSTSAWISSPRFFRDIANLRTLNFSGQAENTAPFLASLPPLTMRALRDLLGDFDWTTVIPSNRAIAGSGSGSDTTYTDLFYGNWSEVIVGRWGGVEVITDQGLSGDNFWTDQRSVKMRMYMDVVVRHDEAILYSRDVRTGSNP